MTKNNDFTQACKKGDLNQIKKLCTKDNVDSGLYYCFSNSLKDSVRQPIIDFLINSGGDINYEDGSIVNKMTFQNNLDNCNSLIHLIEPHHILDNMSVAEKWENNELLSNMKTYLIKNHMLFLASLNSDGYNGITKDFLTKVIFKNELENHLNENKIDNNKLKI